MSANTRNLCVLNDCCGTGDSGKAERRGGPKTQPAITNPCPVPGSASGVWRATPRAAAVPVPYTALKPIRFRDPVDRWPPQEGDQPAHCTSRSWACLQCTGYDSGFPGGLALPGRYGLSPFPGRSGPWRVQARLDLPFAHVIVAAMPFAPGRRPAAPFPRRHPGYWRNRRSSDAGVRRRDRRGAPRSALSAACRQIPCRPGRRQPREPRAPPFR